MWSALSTVAQWINYYFCRKIDSEAFEILLRLLRKRHAPLRYYIFAYTSLRILFCHLSPSRCFSHLGRSRKKNSCLCVCANIPQYPSKALLIPPQLFVIRVHVAFVASEILLPLLGGFGILRKSKRARLQDEVSKEQEQRGWLDDCVCCFFFFFSA